MEIGWYGVLERRKSRDPHRGRGGILSSAHSLSTRVLGRWILRSLSLRRGVDTRILDPTGVGPVPGTVGGERCWIT
jgi:hypothetical protein